MTEFVNLRRLEKRLQSLSVTEKEVLREYIVGETYSLPLNPAAPDTASLIHEGILTRVSDIAIFEDYFAVAIQKRAWKYLNEHRNLVGLNE
jgi:hypothetical protein